jgi:hypothetical protein
MILKIVVRPARLERATSWFVAVNPFVDPAQLTARRMPKEPATWTQCWTQAGVVAAKRYDLAVATTALEKERQGFEPYDRVFLKG